MNADWSRYILKEQHVDLIRICYKKLKILPFKYVAISAELPENEKMHVFCSLEWQLYTYIGGVPFIEAAILFRNVLHSSLCLSSLILSLETQNGS